MLRLTRNAPSDRIQTVVLQGKLVGPWVEEVRQACAAVSAPCHRIRLDLSALIFVDAAGVSLLRDLIARGVEIVACSGFVAELLRSRAPVRASDPEGFIEVEKPKISRQW
jgi:ABC-type transporter Mla MlaB component